MLPLLRSELFRLSRRWMPRIMLLILVAGIVLLYLLFWFALNTQSASETRGLREDLGLAGVPAFGLQIINQVAAILAVVLGSSIIGTEYGWGTIRALLPRATSRSALLAAKLTTLAVFIVLLVVVGYLAATASSALITIAEDLDRDVGSAFFADSLLAVGQTVFAIVPYAALAFMVALWARSNAAGISVALAVLFLEGLLVFFLSLAGDALDWIGDGLLSRNVQAILEANQRDGPSSGLPDTSIAVLVIAVWTVIFLTISFTIFRRRDVTSG